MKLASRIVVGAGGIAFMASAIEPAIAQAPSDLIGKYALDTGGCAESSHGNFRIESRRIFGEGMGCDIISLRRLWGRQGETSMFQVRALCQMDDPQKPLLSGHLLIERIMGRWVLGVNLTVEPKYAKHFTHPALQLFAKC